jgi:pimeloyl-ACP methyl ester carboxylesterase
MLLKMTPCAIGFKFFQKRDRIHTARAVSGSVVLIILIAFMTGPLPNETRETVFILHGLGRTSFSMLMLKHRLQRVGYHVIAKSYASTQGSVSDHVAWLEELLDDCDREDDVQIHFVTHSLGGIIVRKYLAQHAMANLGRVVMLSPPNKGSEVADYFKDWKIFQMAMGPSGQELGTDTGSTPNTLGPVEFELGVITGDASINPFGSWLIPGSDDGAVAVRRTRVDGMMDFTVVHHSHTFIMNASDVADEVISFLRTGAFIHGTTLK